MTRFKKFLVVWLLLNFHSASNCDSFYLLALYGRYARLRPFLGGCKKRADDKDDFEEECNDNDDECKADDDEKEESAVAQVVRKGKEKA